MIHLAFCCLVASMCLAKILLGVFTYKFSRVVTAEKVFALFNVFKHILGHTVH